MLTQARAKKIYDRLAEAEVVAFLKAEASAAYDLVLAADVFMYLDDLAPVLKAAMGAMAPGGMVAFSVETHEGDGVMLRDTLRYAHSVAHVRGALAEAGLTPVSLDSASTRTEKGVPVPGLIVVAGK
jgi:predicted TPR repeat methyltransferase